MIEAWIDEKGCITIQSDCESLKRINHDPKIAGAYFAGKLAVEEHLDFRRRSSSAIIFREVRPGTSNAIGSLASKRGDTLFIKANLFKIRQHKFRGFVRYIKNILVKN